MPRRLLTIAGPDRPGLIAAFTRALADENADLEDVTMTRLEGNFAMILVARGGDEAKLRARIDPIAEQYDLHYQLYPAVESPAEQIPNAFVSAIGPNRVGIVAAISEVMARHGANIVEMSTKLLERTAEPVYMVRLEAALPDEAWDALQDDLTAVSSTLGVQSRLESLEQTDL